MPIMRSKQANKTQKREPTLCLERYPIDLVYCVITIYKTFKKLYWSLKILIRELCSVQNSLQWFQENMLLFKHLPMRAMD